jgi:heat shock protein HtpX
MAYLDEERRRRARLRNIGQSIALVGGIGIITALSAYTLLGGGGIVWALVLVGLFALIGPRIAPDAITRMFNARPIDPSRDTLITQIVSTLSERAGLSAVPRIYVIPSATLNAFAIGTRARYSIGVTQGLLARLDARELAGVLAHEITHVRNNDVWVMSLADILSRLTRTMSFLAIVLFFISVPALLMMGRPMPWATIGLLYFAPTLSSLLQLALSRSREYDADLGAATLTGDPEALASALNKLERYQGRVWEDFVMPGRRIPAPSVLRTHPQTSRRIGRLMALKNLATPALSFPRVQGQMAGIASLQPRPRFHWSGFWY